MQIQVINCNQAWARFVGDDLKKRIINANKYALGTMDYFNAEAWAEEGLSSDSSESAKLFDAWSGGQFGPPGDSFEKANKKCSECTLPKLSSGLRMRKGCQTECGLYLD
ncbi:MAG: hypothetical protein FWE31_04185 [Firmicutes bacterium]|nr:hypothetical protein [Bacillota bacterium]